MLRRVVVPGVLVLAGTWMLTGCGLFGGKARTVPWSPHVRESVGPAGSGKVLQSGVTREQVREVLGSPIRVSRDGQSEAYLEMYDTGVSLCGFPQYRHRVVRIDYDERGVMTGYVPVDEKSDGWGSVERLLPWADADEAQSRVPPKVADARRKERERQKMEAAATRAATSAARPDGAAPVGGYDAAPYAAPGSDRR